MPTSTAGTWNRAAGFTLIELTIVVLLISLFSLLVLPVLTNAPDGDLRSSAQRIAGTVKYLYNEAALNGHQYQLTFNLKEGTFGAKRREADGELVEVEGIGRTRQLKGEARFKEIAVASRGSFSLGEVTTTIYPEGYLEETVIHLGGKGEQQLTLLLMPFTGSTEVYEGYREF